MKPTLLSLVVFALTLTSSAQEINSFVEPDLTGHSVFHSSATFTGQGDADAKSLTFTLPYLTVEAEDFDAQSGVEIVGNNLVQGVAYISDGDYIRFDGAGFANGPAIGGVLASSASGGGTIEFRTGSVDGPLLGTAEITNTGGWRDLEIFLINIVDQDVYLSGNGCLGVQDLYLVFSGTSNYLMAIDKFRFNPADVPIQEVILHNCPEGDVILGEELFFQKSIVPDCPNSPGTLYSVDVGQIGLFSGEYTAETPGEVTVKVTSTSNANVADSCTFTVVEPEGIAPGEASAESMAEGYADYTVFPNPVKDELHISNPDRHSLKVQVTTSAGTLVYEGRGNGDQLIPTASLERGMYLVRIIDGEKVQQSRFFKD